MSSKRALRRRACSGKVRHADRRDAGVALSRLRRRVPGLGEANVYPCGFCGGFHVGHTPQVRPGRRSRFQVA